MDNFFKLTVEEFQNKYLTDEQCFELLSSLKWGNYFRCRKCGHTHFCRGRSVGSRRCTKCKKEESATANTIFHHCKLPIRISMMIALYVYHNPNVSANELCRLFGIRSMTCWRIQKIVRKLKKTYIENPNYEKTTSVSD